MKFKTWTVKDVEEYRAPLDNAEQCALDYILAAYAESRSQDFRLILADAQEFFGLRGKGHTATVDKAFAGLFAKVPGLGVYSGHAVHLSAPFTALLKKHKVSSLPLFLARTHSPKVKGDNALVRYIVKRLLGIVRTKEESKPFSERRLWEQFLEPYGNRRESLWPVLEKAGIIVHDCNRNRTDSFCTFRATLLPEEEEGGLFVPRVKPLPHAAPVSSSSPEAQPQPPARDLTSLSFREKLETLWRGYKRWSNLKKAKGEWYGLQEFWKNPAILQAAQKKLGLSPEEWAGEEGPFFKFALNVSETLARQRERNEREGLPPDGSFAVVEEEGTWFVKVDGKKVDNRNPPKYTRAGFVDSPDKSGLDKAKAFAWACYHNREEGKALKFLEKEDG